MNSIAKLSAAFVAALMLSPLQAQSLPPEAGLIGKSYAGADFIHDQYNGSRIDKANGGAGVLNLPLSRTFDFALGYSYSDLTGPGYDSVDKVLSTSLLTHRPTEYGTAYFAGTLGHSWHRLDVTEAGQRDDGAFWGVRAGYEIPVGRHTAINAGLAYSDSFASALPRNQGLRYFLEANHWITRELAAVASVSYRQIKQRPDAVTLTIGFRVGL